MKPIEKHNKTSFEKIHKTDKPLAKITKRGGGGEKT